MMKQQTAKNAGITEHEAGRRKQTVGARQRSRSVGKSKLDRNLSKQSLKPSVTANEGVPEGSLLPQKRSISSNQVRKSISLQSSVVTDDGSGLTVSMEDVNPDSTGAFLSTTSFSRYKSSTVVHKDAPLLPVAMDASVIRHFETDLSQHKIADVQTYKLLEDVDETFEDPGDTADNEPTEDSTENNGDNATESATNADENTGDAEGDVPDNAEDTADAQNEGAEGQGGPPSGDDAETSLPVEAGEPTVDKILVQFFVLALICKAVSLFFQPNKCTC